MQKFPHLDIASLIPPSLFAYSMTEGTEERLELHDGPILRLGRSSHRSTAMEMMGWCPRWCRLHAQSVRGWWTRIG